MFNATNDHEVTIGSTTRGLTLARDSNGKAMYSVINEIPQYQNPLRVAQNDWSMGHGVFWRNGKPVYFDGQNIDTSKPGVAAVSGYPNPMTKWVWADKVFSDDGGAFADLTSAAKDMTTNDVDLMEAAPVVHDAFYVQMPSATANQITIDISTQGVKGAGGWAITWEGYSSGAWTTLTGLTDNTSEFTAATGLRTVTWTGPTLSTFTVNTVSGFWVRARVSQYTLLDTRPLARQVWVQKASTTTNGLDGAVVAMAYFGTTGTVFVATATSVYEITSLASLVYYQRITFTGDAITHLCEHNGVLYVARGASTLWFYTTDGRTYTQTDLTSANATYFISAPNAAGTASVLWAAKTSNELRSTSDGRTAAAGGVALSTANYVGDTSANLTNIFLVGNRLMVGKTDGLYYYDSSGGVHLVLDLRHNRSTQNFKYVAQFQGRTYASLHMGLLEITEGSYKMVGPYDVIDPLGDTGVPRVQGIASDREFIYVTIASTIGVKAIVYKGREREGHWDWTPFSYLGSNVNSHFSLVAPYDSSYRALVISTTTDLNMLYLYDDPTMAGSQFTFPATAFLRFSYDYGSDPNYDKLYQSVVMDNYGLSASNTVTLKHRKDSETSMTTDTATPVSTNGVTETKLDTQLACKRVQFEVDWALGTTAPADYIPPYLRFFEAKGIEKPTVVRVHEAVYVAGDDPNLSVATLRTFLRGASTNTGLVKFADLRYGETVQSGTNYVWVVMETGYPQEIEVDGEKGRRPELAIKCRWREVSFTVA